MIYGIPSLAWSPQLQHPCQSLMISIRKLACLISLRLKTIVQHKVDEIMQTVAAGSAKIHHVNLVVAFAVTLKGEL
jgi:hypothetical protein